MILKSPVVAAKVWWETVLPSAGLILPHDPWHKCIYNNTRWQDCKEELRVVMQSQVGQKLFSHAWREVADDAVSANIQASVENMFKVEKHVSQAVIDKHRKDLAKEVSQAGADLFVATRPRSIQLSYRSVSFPVMVTTFVEEFNLRVHSCVKQLGVSRGHIDPLFCEAGLCGTEAMAFEGTIDGKLFSETRAARAAVQELVDDPDKASGDEIKNVLQKHSRMLASLDKAWKVEANFFLSQIGETGEKRLQSLVAEALPTAEREMDLETSHARMRTLVAGHLFSFVRVGLQRQVENIVSWLAVMIRGRAPKFPDIAGNHFLANAVGQMAFFLRLPRESAAGSGDARELVGREAMRELLKRVEAELAANKKQDLKTLQPFGTFQWLLSSEEVKKTKEWVAAVVGETAKGKADDMVDKVKEKEKQKKKEKRSKHGDAEEFANSLQQ